MTGDLGAAVTGLGCLSAAGPTVSALSEALFSGTRHVSWRTVRGQRYPVFQLPPDAVPPGYDAGPECRRCGLLAVAAAREALDDAGLGGEARDGLRVGVCLGTTVGSAMNNEDFYRAFRAGRGPDIAPIAAYLRANPADMVAEALGLAGPRQTVTNACASGAVAIGQGAGWIRAGLCDVVLAGGADMLCNVIHAGFLSLMITDTEPCRPFDRERRGLTLGEGAGVVVLESPARAAARGARVRARLCGYGNASDAHHISAPDPEGHGLHRALDRALSEAGLRERDIGFINAHGTGTPENDRCEGALFPARLPGVPFSSTKGFTGHTLGAAGGIEAVITVLCLEQQRIPANLGWSHPDPAFAGRPVTEVTAVDTRYGLSDSVAFGGNNAVLIFGGDAA